MEKRWVGARFFKLYAQGGGFNTGCQIWVDRETNVQYLWLAYNYAGGLTVLVDAEGKPLLYGEKTSRRKGQVDDRFFKLYTQGGGFNANCQIWVDRETNVNYIWHTDGFWQVGSYAGGLTVLLDGEGKPLLYREHNLPEY